MSARYPHAAANRHAARRTVHAVRPSSADGLAQAGDESIVDERADDYLLLWP